MHKPTIPESQNNQNQEHHEDNNTNNIINTHHSQLLNLFNTSSFTSRLDTLSSHTTTHLDTLEDFKINFYDTIFCKYINNILEDDSVKCILNELEATSMGATNRFTNLINLNTLNANTNNSSVRKIENDLNAKAKKNTSNYSGFYGYSGFVNHNFTSNNHNNTKQYGVGRLATNLNLAIQYRPPEDYRIRVKRDNRPKSQVLISKDENNNSKVLQTQTVSKQISRILKCSSVLPNVDLISENSHCLVETVSSRNKIQEKRSESRNQSINKYGEYIEYHQKDNPTKTNNNSHTYVKPKQKQLNSTRGSSINCFKITTDNQDGNITSNLGNDNGNTCVNTSILNSNINNTSVISQNGATNNFNTNRNSPVTDLKSNKNSTTNKTARASKHNRILSIDDKNIFIINQSSNNPSGVHHTQRSSQIDDKKKAKVEYTVKPQTQRNNTNMIKFNTIMMNSKKNSVKEKEDNEAKIKANKEAKIKTNKKKEEKEAKIKSEKADKEAKEKEELLQLRLKKDKEHEEFIKQRQEKEKLNKESIKKQEKLNLDKLEQERVDNDKDQIKEQANKEHHIIEHSEIGSETKQYDLTKDLTIISETEEKHKDNKIEVLPEKEIEANIDSTANTHHNNTQNIIHEDKKTIITEHNVVIESHENTISKTLEKIEIKEVIIEKTEIIDNTVEKTETIDYTKEKTETIDNTKVKEDNNIENILESKEEPKSKPIQEELSELSELTELENKYNQYILNPLFETQLDKKYVISKTSSNSLNFIKPNVETGLLDKDQAPEILNLFKIIYILLDENYDGLEGNKIISNLYELFYPKYKVDSLSK